MEGLDTLLGIAKVVEARLMLLVQRAGAAAVVVGSCDAFDATVKVTRLVTVQSELSLRELDVDMVAAVVVRPWVTLLLLSVTMIKRSRSWLLLWKREKTLEFLPVPPRVVTKRHYCLLLVGLLTQVRVRICAETPSCYRT